MDPSEVSPEYELTIRNHVRQTFLPYARKYITKDHVPYTESKLEQIFTASLDFIPLADPQALVIPPDPLDTFAKSLDSLVPTFEERWTTDADTVRKLKTTLTIIAGEGGKLRSDAYWQENDCTYSRLTEIYRPMTPILTSRARHQAPKPGSSTFRLSLPRTQPSLFEHVGIEPVMVEQVEEPEVAVLEEVLNLCPTVDTALRSYILSRFNLTNLSVQSTQTNVHVTSFLYADSPPRQVESRPLSPPLFSRCKANSGSFRARIENAKDIISGLENVPVPVPEELEDNIDKANMIIVDGWVTLPISSPPSASPTSLQETDIDELWEDLPSTPATSLFGVKMDDVEIPRMHKPGYVLPSTSKARGPNGFRSLIEHLKPVDSRKQMGVDYTTPAKQQHSFPHLFSAHQEGGGSIDTADSLLGQPPSVRAASPLTTNAQRKGMVQSERDSDLEDSEEDLDIALRHVFREVQEKAIEACVLEERLDEKDIELMSVPHLPQPTVHSSVSFRPTNMEALICKSKGSTSMDASLPQHVTLQSVKGIKPLNLELSWRPFKFTPPIPTDESVALVEEPALGEIGKLGKTKIDGLLETVSYPSADVAGSKNFDDICGINSFGLSPPSLVKPFLEDHPFELVLTNGERRLLSGLSETQNLHEDHDKNVDDSQQQQYEASLATEEREKVDRNGLLRNECQPAYLDNNRHLRSNFRNPNKTCPFPRGAGQDLVQGGTPLSSAFHNSGVLDSVTDVFDRSDDAMSCVTFKSQDVVPDDSSVAFSILHDIGGCYNGGFPGSPRCLDAIKDTCNSDEDIQRGFHYTRNQLQDRRQEMVECQDQGSFSPLSLSFRQHSARSLPLSAGYDRDRTGFFPLSFSSRTGRLLMDPIVPAVYPPDNDEDRTRILLQPDNNVRYNVSSSEVQDIRDKNNPESVCSFLQHFVPKADPSTATPASKRRRLEDSKATAVATREFLNDYLTLRNKPVIHDPSVSVPIAISSQPQAGSVSPPPLDVPPEFLDVNTIRLPYSRDPPAASHCYLANMAVIQKRALLRALRTPECQVYLVERYTLDGVDIIVDPDTAVLFAPLLALPSQVEGLSDHILRASWRYTHILVILEAFPSGDALTADGGNRNSTHSVKLTPNAFSPPMLKAVKKLRRLLNIADGFGSKNADCEIHWAFAKNVGEAALFVRVFGDLAEERGLREGRHALWGDRGWLQTDEHEDEANLAAAEGMNPFAAFTMLYEKSLRDIFDMSPQHRMVEFSGLVGNRRIDSLNATIQQRVQQN